MARSESCRDENARHHAREKKRDGQRAENPALLRAFRGLKGKGGHGDFVKQSYHSGSKKSTKLRKERKGESRNLFP
jgi:hypothetical protein